MIISGISRELAPYVTRLIDANKEELIKAATVDPKTREKLLAINKAINDLKLHDGSQVAAWGLGCGGGCLVAPGGEVEIVIR